MARKSTLKLTIKSSHSQLQAMSSEDAETSTQGLLRQARLIKQGAEAVSRAWRQVAP